MVMLIIGLATRIGRRMFFRVLPGSLEQVLAEDWDRWSAEVCLRLRENRRG